MAVGVTETARVAAKTSVKRRQRREALDVSIEEILETAEEAEVLRQAEEPATKGKKGRRKAAVKEETVSDEVELMELPTVFPPGKLVGCHVSAASGCERAVVNAASVGESLYRSLCMSCGIFPAGRATSHSADAVIIALKWDNDMSATLPNW